MKTSICKSPIAIVLLLQTYSIARAWITPIKITPDSSWCQFTTPFVISDDMGKCWFAWDDQNFPANKYYILGRYYEDDTLSRIDTIVPENVAMYITGLNRGTDSRVWVLSEDTNDDIWTRYYEGSLWSSLIAIPAYLPFLNLWSIATVDSANNYHVVWAIDVNLYFSVYGSYYDGNVWSTRVLIPDRSYEAYPLSMTTAFDGSVWLVWGGWYGPADSLFLSIYEDSNWLPSIGVDNNLSDYGHYTPANIAASMSDSCIYVTYRKTNGDIILLRYTSRQQPAETLWINSQYESTPSLVCDDTDRLWLFFCDSIGTPLDYRVYYAIWDGDSVTTPQLVDTLSGYNPRCAFDKYYQRIWVSYKALRNGEHNIYATYMDINDVADKQIEKHLSKQNVYVPTLLAGPLILPKDELFKVFDITGREVKPHLIAPGIYFIEKEGKITQKVVKVR